MPYVQLAGLSESGKTAPARSCSCQHQVIRDALGMASEGHSKSASWPTSVAQHGMTPFAIRGRGLHARELVS